MSHYTHTLGALFLSTALLGAGCTSEGETLLIRQNQSPTTGCMIPNTAGAAIISRGVLDVSVPDEGYVFTPLVQSLALDAETSGGTNVAFVEGADVDLSFPPDFGGNFDSALTSFSTRFTASLPPEGLAGLQFTVVPRELVQALSNSVTGDNRTEITATIQLFGEIDGGSVQSQKFDFFIEVCNGCLVNQVGACSAVPGGFQARTGGQCNQFQDFPVDCCTTEDGQARCPASTEIIDEEEP